MLFLDPFDVNGGKTSALMCCLDKIREKQILTNSINEKGHTFKTFFCVKFITINFILVKFVPNFMLASGLFKPLAAVWNLAVQTVGLAVSPA